MLKIETVESTVRIEGDATDLLALVMWIRIAISRGGALTPSYESGDRQMRVAIMCSDPLESA